MKEHSNLKFWKYFYLKDWKQDKDEEPSEILTDFMLKLFQCPFCEITAQLSPQ